MPSIEFFGYTSEEQEALIATAREVLANLPFKEKIVFVSGGASQALSWNKTASPFIRIHTRVFERGEEIQRRLGKYTDVEIVTVALYLRE